MYFDLGDKRFFALDGKVWIVGFADVVDAVEADVLIKGLKITPFDFDTVDFGIVDGEANQAIAQELFGAEQEVR